MLRRLAYVVVIFAVMLVVGSCGAPDPTIGEAGVIGVAAGTATPDVNSGETPSTTTSASVPASSMPVDSVAVAAGVAVVPPGGAPLSTEPGGPPFVQVHENVVMAFQNRSGTWLEVITTCDDPAWVPADDVDVTPRAERGLPGPGFDLSEAVVVLDPGHGDRDWGGVGPTGLAEKHVNLDIAERVRDRMSAGHTVDWASGAIGPGEDVAPFGAVWLTRDSSGPNEGDFELGLAHRAELANAAGADVLVSIHNNTVPRIDTDIPGTEVYYAISVDDSDRLAGLLYEEVLRSFAPYTANWRGGELQGARARVDPETNDDYYGLLRRATMPSAIVEGVYISEPEEEALLATEEFRQAYADGVYRGIVRFLTTNDEGTGLHDPEPFPDDAGTVDTSACQIPEQP